MRLENALSSDATQVDKVMHTPFDPAATKATMIMEDK